MVRAASVSAPSAFVPVLDSAAIGAIRLTMVTTVAERCGAQLSAATAGKLVATWVSSNLWYSGGCRIFNLLLLRTLAVIPVAGIPAAAGLNVAVNAWITYRVGKRCIERFSESRFTDQEVLDLGDDIVTIPAFSEPGDLKDLLTKCYSGRRA